LDAKVIAGAPQSISRQKPAEEARRNKQPMPRIALTAKSKVPACALIELVDVPHGNEVVAAAIVDPAERVDHIVIAVVCLAISILSVVASFITAHYAI